VNESRTNVVSLGDVETWGRLITLGFFDRFAFSDVIAQGVARPIVESPRASQNQRL
jgi:hypothetical protein